MPKKYFTLEEAQQEIPKIRALLNTLQQLHKAIEMVNSVKLNPHEFDEDEMNLMNIKLNKDFHKLSYEFYQEMEKFEETGCIMKDFDEGLIDFFSKFEGRDIFLCWRVGEDKIKFWHEIEGGFSGRKPIVDLESQTL